MYNYSYVSIYNLDVHWRMDKETGAHIHKAILLSRKEEHIWICSNEVDETRARYTEWSKSEREREVSHTDTYVWNLERRHRWIYLQGSSGETDIENRPLDKVGGGQKGSGMERETETYDTVCKTDSHWDFAVWLRELQQGLCSRLKGEAGRQMGGRSGREGHGYAYGWFLLMIYDRKSQNSVKQLSFNLKNVKNIL